HSDQSRTVPPQDGRPPARPEGIWLRLGGLKYLLQPLPFPVIRGEPQPVFQRRQQRLPPSAAPHPRRGGLRRGQVYPVVRQRLRIQGSGPREVEVPFLDRGFLQPDAVQFDQQAAIRLRLFHRRPHLTHALDQFLGRRSRRQYSLGLLQRRP